MALLDGGQHGAEEGRVQLGEENTLLGVLLCLGLTDLKGHPQMPATTGSRGGLLINFYLNT